MTLFKQLLFFTLTIFFLLLVIIWVEKIQSTSAFLMDQMDSHTQDTATSLALSLTPAITENDIATVDTMVNAVFDRGYYKVIRLNDIYGKLITERNLTVKIDGIPSWFVNLVPLEVQGSEALLMAGWNQAGILYVESHPGYAYQTLWKTAVQITIYFLILCILVIIFGSIGLKILLRPLQMVEKQAEAIGRKEYRLQEKLPRTRELRNVVKSMNSMATKVRDMFKQQSLAAERLRKNAYSDQLTGLGNRRYLTSQVEANLQKENDPINGGFLLVQVHDLQKINDEKGFTAGDELLLKVSEIIRNETAAITTAILARLTGGDFSVFMPEVQPDDVNFIAENIASGLTRLATEQIGGSDNIAHVAGVFYNKTVSFTDLLSAADSTLRTAQRLGPNKWVVRAMQTDRSDLSQGKGWWKETLNKAIRNEDILLHGQIVVSGDRKTILHTEIFSRIAIDSGELVNAGVFIPLAERLQVVSRLDRIVLEKAMQLKGVKAIAVNVSPSSLEDQDFQEWLFTELHNGSEQEPIIAFEFTEFSAVQSLDTLKAFSQKIKQLGHRIGLDHFGLSFSNFGYLKSLQPDYVKIDRGYTKELNSEQGDDSHFFIGSLCGVAHSLDIQVIAEGVECQSQLEMLRELDVDGIQGYLIEKPGAIIAENN